MILGTFRVVIILLRIEFSRSRMENLRTSKDTVKQTILILFGTDFNPKRYRFEVRKGPFLRSRNDRKMRFTRRRNIAKTLDVMQKQRFSEFQVSF